MKDKEGKRATEQGSGDFDELSRVGATVRKTRGQKSEVRM